MSETFEVTKTILIDAIIGGVSIPMGGFNPEITPFTGNQWNEEWSWNREALEKMSTADLAVFYATHRDD